MRRLCALSLLAASVSAFSAEFISNGDFEAGNIGFTSDYSYVSPGGGSLGPQGVYTVDTNPNNSHGGFAIMGDHTSGTGLFMIVNGMAGDTSVWEQTVTGLLIGGSYTFSGWGSSVHPASPATLDFQVDGVSVDTITLTSGTPDWIFGSGAFTATASSVVLRVVDLNGDSFGNDLSIDDLSLTGPVPEPTSVLVLGLGVFGLARRAKS